MSTPVASFDTSANPIVVDPDEQVSAILGEFEAREKAAQVGGGEGAPAPDPDTAPVAPATPPAPSAGPTADQLLENPPGADPTLEPADGPEPIRVLPDPPAPGATVNIGGQDIPVEQVEQALGTVGYLQQLSPAQLQAFSDIAAGTHVLVPRDQSAASGSGYGNPAPVGPPPVPGNLPGQPPPYAGQPPAPGAPAQPPAAPTAPAIDPESFLDPAMARYIQQRDQQYDAQLAQIQQAHQAQLAQIAQQQAEQTRHQIGADVQAGRDAFRSQLPFGDAEMEDIERRAVEMQLVPTYRAQGMTTADATREAMTTAVWSDPRYRDALIHHQMAGVQQQQDDLATRRNKAAALSGGAAVSRVTPAVDPRNMSQTQRFDAIANEIDKAMNGAV